MSLTTLRPCSSICNLIPKPIELRIAVESNLPPGARYQMKMYTSLGPTLLCKDQIGSQAFSFYHLMCCSCHKTDHPQESTLIYYISVNYVRKAVGCDRQFEQRRICRKISNLSMSNQTPSLQVVHI